MFANFEQNQIFVLLELDIQIILLNLHLACIQHIFPENGNTEKVCLPNSLDQ